jgi:hypothetical protein
VAIAECFIDLQAPLSNMTQNLGLQHSEEASWPYSTHILSGSREASDQAGEPNLKSDLVLPCSTQALKAGLTFVIYRPDCRITQFHGLPRPPFGLYLVADVRRYARSGRAVPTTEAEVSLGAGTEWPRPSGSVHPAI